jgi:hypothetical protein
LQATPLQSRLLGRVFHRRITTQIPHSVSLALEKGVESPRIDYPSVIVYRFSRTSLTAGIEEHEIDGVKVRVYSAEKTIHGVRKKPDCHRFATAYLLKLKRTDGRLMNCSSTMQWSDFCIVSRNPNMLAGSS